MPTLRASQEQLHPPRQVRNLRRVSRHRPVHQEAQGGTKNFCKLHGNPPRIEQGLQGQEIISRGPEDHTAQLHGHAPPSTSSHVHLGTTNIGSTHSPDSTRKWKCPRLPSLRTGGEGEEKPSKTASRDPVPTRQPPAHVPEEHIIITKEELKDLFTSFAGTLAGMLGQTVQEDELTELADKVLETKLKKRSSRSPTKTQHRQTQPQPPAPGTTPATAAIEAEKKALGLPTTHPEGTGQTTTPVTTICPHQKHTPLPTNRKQSASYSGTSTACEEDNIC